MLQLSVFLATAHSLPTHKHEHSHSTDSHTGGHTHQHTFPSLRIFCSAQCENPTKTMPHGVLHLHSPMVLYLDLVSAFLYSSGVTGRPASPGLSLVLRPQERSLYRAIGESKESQLKVTKSIGNNVKVEKLSSSVEVKFCVGHQGASSWELCTGTVFWWHI